METANTTSLPITNKRFRVTHKNEYDQVDTLEGILIHPDMNGFVVINVNGVLTAIPKDKIFIMREGVSK